MYPGRSAGELVEAVIAADEAGLDEVWIADEGVAREPMVVLAAAARSTTRVTLAVGITSPLIRHPGAIAATVATLDELSGGRALLGLGVGGHESLGPFGISTDRPVGVLRDAIRIGRAVFAGEPCAGYEPAGHAVPPRRVPIWVGARGPQLVRVAAREADGVFLSGCTPDEHERIVDQVGRVAGDDRRPMIATAMYQSASDRLSGANVIGWDRIVDTLAADVDRFAPTSIGINLVDLASPDGAGAPDMVSRAASALNSV
jgi:alkanesulfonate monooxygenase SsuD/methylene tetrahydromethanopterin reductase-like flavin-dependent oxidoreductase (luciferase family)